MMKWPDFKPHWALWFGFLVAPLACSLNAALLENFVSDSPIRTGEWLPIGIVMSFITGPQGGATYAILLLWNEREQRMARGFSLFCGLVSPLFWWFCWHGLEIKIQWGRRGAVALFGALILPVLWSLLFLLFPLLARAKNPTSKP